MPVAAGQAIGAPGKHPGRPLGLGLGLNPKKRRAIREDLAAGNTGAASSIAGTGTNPGARMRFNRLLDPNRTGPAAQRAQSMFGATNPAGYAAPGMPPPPGAAPPPPPANPAGNLAPNPAGIPPPGAAPPATPLTFADILKQQFGADNPFGVRGNYNDPNNPIYNAATQNFQRGLGQIRAGFGDRGLGNSSREALAEGDAAANYGAQIATTGEQAYQNDANRALSSILGAGQLNLGQQQLPLQYLQSLISAGGGLLGQEGSEQVPPLIQALLPFLGLGASQTSSGTSSQR